MTHRSSPPRTLPIALLSLALAAAGLATRCPAQDAPPSGVPGALLGAAPFDRLTLIDGTVLEVEPVSPRPLPAYDPAREKKRLEQGVRPTREGNIFLPGEKSRAGAGAGAAEDKDAEAVPDTLTIHLLRGEVRDYKVKRTDIKRIEYFEQMLLDEGERYRLARDYQRAFECYLQVEARKRDWPGLDEHVDRLLYDEGSAALLEGTGEAGLRILRELAARRRDYPGLADRLASAFGSRIARAFDLGLYARGRKVLHDLEPLAPNHRVVRDARERFLARARELAAEASRRPDPAGRLDALTEALRVWPGLEGAPAHYAQAFTTLPTLDVAVTDVPRAFGPWVRSPADARVTRLVYLPILARGDEESAQGRPSGQLAARLEATELGRRVVLDLRPGISWADGTKAHPRAVSSSDVFSALVARTDPASPRFSARWASLLEHVECLEDTRVELRLGRPILKLETSLVTPVGPAHLGAGTGRPILGDGPYRGTTAGDGGDHDGFELRASGPNPPRIVRIRERRYASASAAVGALVRGEVSLAAHVPAGRLAELSAREELKVGVLAHPSLHRIALDGRNSVLRNRALRRALSLAIDRRALLEETLLRRPADASNRVLGGPFARTGADEGPDVPPPEHDPLLAKMLVAGARRELGGEPIKLTLEYPAAPEPQAVVPKLVEAFRLAGLEIKAVERPESELEAELRAGRTFDLAYRAGPCVEPVLEAGGLICPGFEAPPGADALSSVASPRILQLLLALERAPEWPTAQGLVLQIQRECRDELPVLALWQLEDHYAWRTRLEGPGERTERLYEGIESWRIGPWFARDPW
jgi:peptide/nickel transport system substrate-binding protein